MDEPVDDNEQDVERIPFDRSLHVSKRDLVRIVMLIGSLFAVIMLAKPCAEGVSQFVVGVQPQNDQPSVVDDNMKQMGIGPTVKLAPTMSDEEIKAAIEEAHRLAKQAGDKATTSPSDAQPSDSTPPKK